MIAFKSHKKLQCKFSLLVLNDRNACIGKDWWKLLPRQIGPHLTEKESSRKGKLLAEFLWDLNRRVQNGFFTKKLSKKCNWRHPRTNKLSFEDYCLTPINTSYRIQHVRCSWSDNANGDHAMAIIIASCKIKSSIKKPKRGQDTKSRVREKGALITKIPQLFERLNETVKIDVAKLWTVPNVTEMLFDTVRDFEIGCDVFTVKIKSWSNFLTSEKKKRY